MVRTHNGVLFSHDKGEYPPTCGNMDGPWAYYDKQEESEKNE